MKKVSEVDIEVAFGQILKLIAAMFRKWKER
jgi:hypothetical protein